MTDFSIGRRWYDDMAMWLRWGIELIPWIIVMTLLAQVGMWWDMQRRFEKDTGLILQNQMSIQQALKQGAENDKQLERLTSNQYDEMIKQDELLRNLIENERATIQARAEARKAAQAAAKLALKQ